MNSNHIISVVIPVYNEEAVIESQIEDLYLKMRNNNFELILVENGSTDSSWRLCKKLSKKFKQIILLRMNERSYGKAIKKGIDHSRGKFIVIFNVDYYDIPFLEKAVGLLSQADVVVASKTMESSSDRRPPHRRLVTYFFNVFLRLILNYPGTDTHGIKAFKNSRLLNECVNQCRTEHELFDTELILRLTRSGGVLVELPTMVQEIRPTRYALWGRLQSTALDLVHAMWAKYGNTALRKKSKVMVLDDFGISGEVNKAIVDYVHHNKNVVVSILANMCGEKAVNSLKVIQNDIGFSCHFNLVEGKPISPVNKIPHLVTKDGAFYSLAMLYLKLLMGLIPEKEIEIELNAQLARLKTFNISIGHCDSHQHTHHFRPISHVVDGIAKKHKLSVRSTHSTRIYLFNKPLRLLAFVLMRLLLIIRYPGDEYFSSDEYILHPGSNYDRWRVF